MGSTDLSPGVVPSHVQDVVYTPHAYFFGEDTIEMSGSDNNCAYRKSRRAESTTLSITVDPVASAPKLLDGEELVVLGGSEGACVRLEAEDRDLQVAEGLAQDAEVRPRTVPTAVASNTNSPLAQASEVRPKTHIATINTPPSTH